MRVSVPLHDSMGYKLSGGRGAATTSTQNMKAKHDSMGYSLLIRRGNCVEFHT